MGGVCNHLSLLEKAYCSFFFFFKPELNSDMSLCSICLMARTALNNVIIGIDIKTVIH